MELTILAQRIKQAPTTPGVYLWRDTRGRLLYVGKAINLRSRLRNYLKATDSRIRIMVGESKHLDWRTTPTDIEALILESQLIKELKPRHNIVMRDDKQYSYVVITKEDFPKLVVTHQPFGKLRASPANVIGPFTEGGPLKVTLHALRRIFPYCTCKQKHHVKCLNAHIGKCLGYCCLRTPATGEQKAEYRKHIRAIRDILTGKRESVVKRFEKTDEFIGRRIRRVFENARINTRLAAHTDSPHRVEGYDIAHMQGKHTVGAMVVFTDGAPDKTQYRLFNIEEAIEGDVPQLRHMFERRLKHSEWPQPDLVVVDGAQGQLNAAAKAFNNIPVIAVTKDDRHKASRMITTTGVDSRLWNLSVHVDSEAHRFSIQNYRRRHRKMLV